MLSEPTTLPPYIMKDIILKTSQPRIKRLVENPKRAALYERRRLKQSLHFINNNWMFVKKVISIKLWEDFVLEVHGRDLADLSSFVVMGNQYSLQTHKMQSVAPEDGHVSPKARALSNNRK